MRILQPITKRRIPNTYILFTQIVSIFFVEQNKIESFIQNIDKEINHIMEYNSQQNETLQQCRKQFAALEKYMKKQQKQIKENEKRIKEQQNTIAEQETKIVGVQNDLREFTWKLELSEKCSALITQEFSIGYP